ncbi:peroxisomal fatty acid beta-oxidation multifunctional protein AIM1-like isoform X2 [Durio zibethinus]|uniref:Peroxisomal fatty acid beta-oxidation multifunctional protein AIM1-like isoform X2 n=1 Tax=Durio zibethinus TaxID=66656 RepID=A0A6P5ZAI2_DURZI|nr:peroxisomal fatty acid beta-oxidation multifunctional protein AIM1-like isoform X2 [Durio zibethinus]
MSQIRVTMEVGNDGVAVIAISDPPVNALAIPTIAGLKEKFHEATRRSDVKAIVLTGKGGRFSGGFDINVFQKVHETGDVSIMPDVSIDLVVNAIEDCKKPVVAAVEGLALGGGLELAMGCHARIAAPRAQLGLPELSLGVIPGFGGTQRLPRLVGLSKAIEIMLSSKPIMSEEGKKLGLIDALVPFEELLKVSRKWALDIAERRKPWLRSLHRTDKIGSLSEARKVLKIARQQAKKTAPNLPQHQACLDVIEEGIVHGGYNGVLQEAKVFKELVLSDTAKGLVHVFLAQRATSKVPNVTDVGLKPRQTKKVAIIGGGLMGSGIATALIVSNIFVVLKEVNSEYLLKGIKMIEANIRGLVAKGKLTNDKAEKALSMLKGVLDYTEFKDVDMVIEAVVENVPLKQKIFSEIEKACPRHCILATNTSTIDLNLIGEKIKSQDHVIGAHFFRLQDLAGYGVALAVGKEYAKAFPDRIFKSPLVELLVKNGRNGKNNGKGYYIYEKGSKPKPDPSVLPIIEESRQLTKIMPGGKPISVTDKEILEMILFPVVNEACRVLHEGIVVRASDLDIASVLGMSFPSYRGGIVFWADTVGANHVYKNLKRWSEIYGNFYKPSKFLEERAIKGIPLSAPATSSPSSRL